MKKTAISILLAAATLTGTAQAQSSQIDYSVSYSQTNAAYKNKDYVTAMQELKPLAEQGDTNAQVMVGYMYINGQGVPTNSAEGISWYQRAAAQGNRAAQFNLGVNYQFGQNSLPKDPEKAFNFIKQSANNGYAKAQTKLGFFYYTGIGVPVDYKLSLYWSALGLKNGDPDAEKNVSIVFRKAVPEETVAFGSYRILSQTQATTYAITNNPRTGLIINYGDATAVNAMKRGAVRACRLMTAPQVAWMQTTAQKITVQVLTPIGVTAGLSGQSLANLTANLPPDQQENFILAKNLVDFVSQTGDIPYYLCDRS
ncbi:tetratricopeptide repeat protein [Burkholderia cenocepacia]|uniref:tetratricopeptide repeat protein n=1 Tax=Burkholderia cenocepacia TaxID=95486 RepID=UPI002858B5BD|nr:tetratricopeptide repeat protein [Burkholderia cenocepacia]MDR8054190.1 sel1 repeat family protein [Burkholderia cenocepacia]MDR8064633.1 sel1 repeat family protein [Burkholderia cenocepacia]